MMACLFDVGLLSLLMSVSQVEPLPFQGGFNLLIAQNLLAPAFLAAKS
jgi:hypothetical protein